MRKKNKGLLITFEGPEGSGKSTQSRKLKGYLTSRGIPVLLTREPGGTRMGRSIRELLLKPTRKLFSPRSELFLYLADRAQHVDEKIKPFMEKGGVVISDRFTDATLAYQGFGRTLKSRQLRELNRLATGDLKPDMTFLLDVPPEKGLRAAKKASREKMNYARGDRLEQETTEFHHAVRRGYLTIARQEPRRVKKIRGIGNRSHIFEEILRQLTPLLHKTYPRLKKHRP